MNIINKILMIITIIVIYQNKINWKKVLAVNMKILTNIIKLQIYLKLKLIIVNKIHK